MLEHVSIKKATNGYIVEVDCITLVFRDLTELLEDLRTYFAEDKEGRACLEKKFKIHDPVLGSIRIRPPAKRAATSETMGPGL